MLSGEDHLCRAGHLPGAGPGGHLRGAAAAWTEHTAAAGADLVVDTALVRGDHLTLALQYTPVGRFTHGNVVVWGTEESCLVVDCREGDTEEEISLYVR